MITLSSALRAAMATDYGLGAMMQRGCIKIFTGPPPLNADNAEQGTLLGTITQGGLPFTPGNESGGLKLKAGPVNGACQNDGEWQLNVSQSGLAGWWRFVWNSPDNGSGNEFTPRIDGRIGEGLWLPDKNLETSDTLAITSFSFIIPPTTN